MFGSVGAPELILLFVVALLLFGPRKLPELGKSLGKGILEFRRASNELRNTLEADVEEEKQKAKPALPAPAAAATTEAPPVPAEQVPAARSDGDQPS